MNVISNALLAALLGNEINELYCVEEALYEGVAEDMNEAAMFGDGPCGSADRRFRLWEVTDLIGQLRLWIYDLTTPPAPQVAEFAPEEIPF